jgi:hypothetical protein
VFGTVFKMKQNCNLVDNFSFLFQINLLDLICCENISRSDLCLCSNNGKKKI